MAAQYNSKAAHQVYRLVPGAERHLQRLLFHKQAVTIDLENSKVGTTAKPLLKLACGRPTYICQHLSQYKLI